MYKALTVITYASQQNQNWLFGEKQIPVILRSIRFNDSLFDSKKNPEKRFQIVRLRNVYLPRIRRILLSAMTQKILEKN